MTREHFSEFPSHERERAPQQLTASDIENLPDLSQELIELHEVTEAFDNAVLPLNPTLQEMLGEHTRHQGNRKGSGFTQASRHLAEFVNRGRSSRDTSIFDPSIDADIRDAWSHANPDADEYLNDTRPFINNNKLHAIPDAIQNEESKLIANLAVDIVSPREIPQDAIVLPPAPKIDIGTCTSAELYFLELVNDKKTYHSRSGEMHVITDTAGAPVMIEKIGLGESHSCITLRETYLNGVKLPPGSLVGVDRPQFDKKAYRLDECKGFKFLRLTTLAVSPENRARAFRAHYTFQENSEMPGFATTTIEDFVTEAKLMVKSDRLVAEMRADMSRMKAGAAVYSSSHTPDQE